MAKALKVYRTPAGFHDAYVAAPSRAAALRAWGSARDLFALGAAEDVTDPELMRAPLATPGEVVRVARIDEGGEEAPAAKVRAKPQPAIKRPSCSALDDAEAKLAAIDGKFAAERDALDVREAALAAERRKLVAAETMARDKAQAAIDRARAAYDDKLDAWCQASG